MAEVGPGLDTHFLAGPPYVSRLTLHILGDALPRRSRSRRLGRGQQLLEPGDRGADRAQPHLPQNPAKAPDRKSLEVRLQARRLLEARRELTGEKRLALVRHQQWHEVQLQDEVKADVTVVQDRIDKPTLELDRARVGQLINAAGRPGSDRLEVRDHQSAPLQSLQGGVEVGKVDVERAAQVGLGTKLRGQVVAMTRREAQQAKYRVFDWADRVGLVVHC